MFLARRTLLECIDRIINLRLMQCIHTSSICEKRDDRKAMMASMPKRDEGVQGEKSFDIDSPMLRKSIFPDENTPNLIFGDTLYSELPIIYIKVTKNNTIMTLTDYKGKFIVGRSCGMEGFKNTRKGTNVAAQATAISMSLKALENDCKNVRVVIKGLGPGRMSSIKGLQIGGLDIVSITDKTPVPEPGPRARKARRI
ncbi:small ribosomal subunit protein uS11 [Centruroides vittatus]|uniref:small ribosomal subunit protein uS11 n=1 Tax=Centruroides vittatus TaxID=120091 RepID=UPI003510BA57